MFDGLEVIVNDEVFSFSEVPDQVLVVTFLKNAKQFISKRRNWCQGPMRLEFSGFLGIGAKTAYCSAGALQAEMKAQEISGKFFEVKNVVLYKVRDYLNKAAIARGDTHYISYNDNPNNNHRDIMGMWNDAIAASEKDLSEKERRNEMEKARYR